MNFFLCQKKDHPIFVPFHFFFLKNFIFVPWNENEIIYFQKMYFIYVPLFFRNENEIKCFQKIVFHFRSGTKMKRINELILDLGLNLNQ